MSRISRREFGGLLAAAASPEVRRFELRNDRFQLTVRAGADGIWIERLLMNQEDAWPGHGFTGNLIAPAGEPLTRSGTAILPEGGGWHTSWADAATATATERRLHIPDVRLGPAAHPLAREDWVFELEGDRLRWRIDRTFPGPVKLAADRFPALVFNTKGSPFGDVPGFLDREMRLDGTRGFVLDRKARWYQAVSPVRQQVIHLAPSGLALTGSLSTGSFAYAKTPADGTAAAVSVGGTAGTARRQEWALVAGRHAGVAPFHLELPDRALMEQCHSFAAVHNQWMGWIFGNNPASVPCLHEAGFFSMIQGIYARSAEVEQAMAKELRFFVETGIEPDGYVFPRWWIEGYYRVPWGNLLDQQPHLILAAYFHALSSGDRALMRAFMPALDRVARYILALDADGDGVFEVPGTSGLPDGRHDCSNWYDIIKFGHKDAYFNVYCVWALQALAELAAWVGERAAAAEYTRAHRRAAAAFNRVFWDAERGIYMDWIDTRGVGRRYFYTDHNLLAIILGIADASQATRILANLDRRYDELCREFRLPREDIWATPCNMNPVTDLGDLVNFGELGNQKVFPNYENGCSFFHTTGFEIAARAVAGQAEAAYDTFDRVMRHGYARNRFWCAAHKWDTGRLVSEPLNDSLVVLWGFLRGALGAWPGLDGIRLAGGVSKRLEGARYTFNYLGRDTTLSVRNGKASRC